jgi:hypothetical protein
MAKILQVALGIVNIDYQYLKKLALADISKYINETLPLEFQKCMIAWIQYWSRLGAWQIVLEIWRGINCRPIAMQLLSSATVVKRVHFVEFTTTNQEILQIVEVIEVPLNY